MTHPLFRSRARAGLAAAAVGAALVAAGGTIAWAGPSSVTGPSSSDAPYLVGAAPGVRFTSVLTAGDTVGGYAMAGTPDGLGAYDNGDGTFTVLANHEFAATAGIARAHGGKGAFVSQWVVDKRTLTVLSGKDLVKTVYLWQNGAYVATPNVTFNRFCSADLPKQSALYNPRTRKGFPGKLFLNGEEAGLTGRAFAHVVSTGESYELPALGKASWENVVANPATGDTTVVAGLSDTGGGRVVVYVGTKQSTGSPVEKAGLANGTRYVVSVPGVTAEDGAQPFPASSPFTLVPDPVNNTAGTGFDRPEDGAWDPKRPNDFYFVTTASITKQSRLWRLRFVDAKNPTLGGTLEKLVEGPADAANGGPKMMDNLTVDDGAVLIQEDPGNNAYLAGIYRYDLKKGTLTRIANHDPARFTTGGALFDTVDEESSGIVPVPFLGEGRYLVADQNHTPVATPGQVEKGQLLVLRVPDED